MNESIVFVPVAGGSSCTVSSYLYASYDHGKNVKWLSSESVSSAFSAETISFYSLEKTKADDLFVVDDSERTYPTQKGIRIGCIRNDYLSLKAALTSDVVGFVCLFNPDSALNRRDVEQVLDGRPVVFFEIDAKIARLVDAGLYDRLLEYTTEYQQRLVEMVDQVREHPYVDNTL
jgi:hypothetical protein